MGTKRIWEYFVQKVGFCCLEEGNTCAKVTNVEQGERCSINSKLHSLRIKVNYKILTLYIYMYSVTEAKEVKNDISPGLYAQCTYIQKYIICSHKTLHQSCIHNITIHVLLHAYNNIVHVLVLCTHVTMYTLISYSNSLYMHELELLICEYIYYEFHQVGHTQSVWEEIHRHRRR